MSDLLKWREAHQRLSLTPLGIESRTKRVFNIEVANAAFATNYLALPVDPTYQAPSQDADGQPAMFFGLSPWGMSAMGGPSTTRTLP